MDIILPGHLSQLSGAGNMVVYTTTVLLVASAAAAAQVSPWVSIQLTSAFFLLFFFINVFNKKVNSRLNIGILRCTYKVTFPCLTYLNINILHVDCG